MLGSATCSGILHLRFALHMVLSSTNLGSLPSAMTMLSSPTAVPGGQRLCASSLEPSKGRTCPACNSFSGVRPAMRAVAWPLTSCLRSAVAVCRQGYRLTDAGRKVIKDACGHPCMQQIKAVRPLGRRMLMRSTSSPASGEANAEAIILGA